MENTPYEIIEPPADAHFGVQRRCRQRPPKALEFRQRNSLFSSVDYTNLYETRQEKRRIDEKDVE